MISYLFGVLKRSFLFQFIFVFSFLKWRELSKSSYEFKDKIYETTALANFKHHLIDQTLANPTSAFQAFIGIQVFSAALAVLGSRFFSFLSGLFLLVTSVIYYNPLKVAGKPNQIISLENINLNFFLTLPIEFYLLFVYSLAVFTQAFSSRCCNKKSQTVEEVGQSETPDSRRQPSSNSQKKKRVH